MTETDCDNLTFDIADGNLTYADAIAAYERALIDDPTESDHAAHIRDAIRDNFDEMP